VNERQWGRVFQAAQVLQRLNQLQADQATILAQQMSVGHLPGWHRSGLDLGYTERDGPHRH
jgi:hypothetical protein